MKVQVENIRKVSSEILMASGVPKEHADMVADTIVYAHTRGKHTHGLGRINIYLRKIKENLMAADTPMEVLHDFGAVCHYDAHNGFGQVAAYIGMQTAIERAEKFGIGFVLVKDSNNFGTAGYFSKLAADKKMIGFVCANSGPAIAPAVGGKALFGTNPISMAYPTDDPENPVIFDMATSTAARGKIRLAAKNGESIPADWALDENGQPTIDPNKALLGSMLPIGGYKGVGLSLMVDFLAGLMSGAAFAGDVKNLNHKTELSRYGHALIAIDITKFMDYNEYLEKNEYLTGRVHEYGGTLPGEHSFEYVKQYRDEVDIPDKQYAEINDIAKSLGLTCSL
ncbi:malate dehydrogenase (NAD) /L-sulfolactate dehydrogenase [Eubacterium ruminantium]|nr:malate dehydrogenase (NAD) /L-sulfolactate dehydrogenase [Eubacterium ruminantium]